MTARRPAVVASVLSLLAVGLRAPAVEGPLSFAIRDTRAQAGEPTVGVLSDGSIVYQALTKVLKTTDEGRTWTTVHSAVTGQQTRDPYLHVDAETDRIVSSQLFGLPSTPGGECQVVSVSDDGGVSWIETAQCGTVDHQKIGSGPWPAGFGGVYERAVYTCSNRLVDTACATSLDGGLTWGPQVPVFLGVDPELNPGPEAPGFCGGLEGDPVSGADGAIYLPREHCGRALLGVSRDAGATWNIVRVMGGAQVRPIGYGANNPAVTVSPNGTIYYAWTGDDWRHHVARSRDDGETWSEIYRSPVPSTTFPLVLAGRDGSVATAYLGTDAEGGPDGVGESARWHLHVALSTDAEGASPQWMEARATPDGDPVMIGCIGRHGPLCSNNVLLDFNDIALTRDGRLVISYTDACYPALCSGKSTSGRRDGFLAVQTFGPTLR